MSSKRKKQKKSGVQPPPAPSVASAPGISSEIPPALKSLMEQAADCAKIELASSGKIVPKALFVYDGESPTSAPRTVEVMLSFRNEEQKDALKKRVREKAVEEGAQAVVVVDQIGGQQVSIFGASADARIAASISYQFDVKTKAIDRWDLQWRTTPLDD
jgi:hypothetical protein